MTLYLQMDGVDDYLRTPSLTFTEVQIDLQVTHRASTQYFYVDARTGIGLAYVNRATNGTDGMSVFNAVYIDGVQKTSGTAFVPSTRCIMRVVKNTAGTDDVNIFSSNSGTACTQGNIYNIKFYNGATLVAHYDMTTGTVQDQSGNGRHATLTGGTWLDDGTGGGTNVTVTSITANTTASSLVPTVSAQQQVSVSSVVANATINALNPQVGVFTNVVVNALIANVTASANVPNVGTVRNINIAHIIPNMLATAIIPTIRIVEPVIFRVGIPVTSILEKELVLRSELENTMPVSTNIISTITINPTV